MIRARYETLEIKLTEEEKEILQYMLKRRMGIVDIKLVASEEKEASVLKVGMEINDSNSSKGLEAGNAVRLLDLDEDELALRELLEKLENTQLEADWNEANRKINLLHDATFADDEEENEV